MTTQQCDHDFFLSYLADTLATSEKIEIVVYIMRYILHILALIIIEANFCEKKNL